jgi:hypothetical protein
VFRRQQRRSGSRPGTVPLPRSSWKVSRSPGIVQVESGSPADHSLLRRKRQRERRSQDGREDFNRAEPSIWDGLEVVRRRVTRPCGRPSDARMKAAPASRAQERKDAPPPRREPRPPAHASPLATRRFVSPRAESTRRQPRAWRRQPPAHRGPGRAPSTPTAFRWEDDEWCPRHAGGRSRRLRPAPP